MWGKDKEKVIVYANAYGYGYFSEAVHCMKNSGSTYDKIAERFGRSGVSIARMYRAIIDEIEKKELPGYKISKGAFNYHKNRRALLASAKECSVPGCKNKVAIHLGFRMLCEFHGTRSSNDITDEYRHGAIWT
jgi:hypothetical protein